MKLKMPSWDDSFFSAELSSCFRHSSNGLHFWKGREKSSLVMPLVPSWQSATVTTVRWGCIGRSIASGPICHPSLPSDTQEKPMLVLQCTNNPSRPQTWPQTINACVVRDVNSIRIQALRLCGRALIKAWPQCLKRVVRIHQLFPLTSRLITFNTPFMPSCV